MPQHYTTQFCSVEVSNGRFSESVAGGEIKYDEYYDHQSILLQRAVSLAGGKEGRKEGTYFANIRQSKF